VWSSAGGMTSLISFINLEGRPEGHALVLNNDWILHTGESMSSAPPHFEESLKRYLEDVKLANSEASKAYLFLEFLRNTFKQANTDYLEKLFPVLEKHLRGTAKTLVVKGRVDAFLGNLIIEFKKNLDEKSQEEAESELRRYISVLWTEQKTRRVSYVAMATDGLHFVSYRPRAAPEADEVLPDDVELDQIDRLDLTKIKPGPAFVWLDRYVLAATPQPATAEAFSSQFGLNKPAFNDAQAFLKEAWKNGYERVLYEQWASYLRIVYGSQVDSEDLFIRHTYLAMLAKLLAYSSFSGGALPVSQEQIGEILEGRVFEKWNVHNFLEEDFFAWVARSDEGIKAASALLERLASYDISTIDEDILKSLYQELVDPQARHDLGEYYTPDWLAELMVERAVGEDPEKTVLDPACGSGTFLAAAVRRKKQLLKKKKPRERLEIILSTVTGVDIHPLAVILSRTNFLTSLGTELLTARRGPISIPVYMADSIRLPESDVSVYAGVKSFTIRAEGKFLRLPFRIAKDPNLTDRAVEAVKYYARNLAKGERPKLEDFENMLSQRVGERQVETNETKVLLDTADTMAKLIGLKKDTVWAFILKNIYKPLFLQEEKFDVVIGNPPWLSYRYVESTDYQGFLKGLILKNYRLLDSERAELITQMELATLFFARTSDLYLSDSGTISLVMPRSLFVGDQHHNFRKGAFAPKMKMIEMFDLEDVDPLFRVPSCVITAKKGKNQYPIDGIVFAGTLSQKNAKLDEAKKSLTQTRKKFEYYEIGQRSFIESQEFEKVLRAIERGGRSPYYETFYNGATIYPRQFWFVEPIVHPKFGIDPTRPRLKTSQRATVRAKGGYGDVSIEGEVESKFLYQVVTGSELAPFCTTTMPVVILPIEPAARTYRIIDSDEAQRKGYSGLKAWLLDVEKKWKEKRGEKAEKVDVYSWLNYQNKLTNQRSQVGYRVLYNASGTYLVASVVENRSRVVKVDSSEIKISGVIADVKTFRYDTSDLDEALFIAAILNAPIVDSLIKPMQSRGQFGERDIHKKVLELPLPKFRPKDKGHLELVRLAKQAQGKVEKIVPELERRYFSIGKIRQMVKSEIEEELLKIDKIVRDLISETADLPNGLDDYL
jgi:methylase of polypeptide subunit release factors